MVIVDALARHYAHEFDGTALIACEVGESVEVAQALLPWQHSAFAQDADV